MNQNEGSTSQQETKLNKQMSPLAIAGLAGGATIAWFMYQYSDIVRALSIGGLVFVLLFWVVWQGQKLEKQRKDKNDV